MTYRGGASHLPFNLLFSRVAGVVRRVILVLQRQGQPCAILLSCMCHRHTSNRTITVKQHNDSASTYPGSVHCLCLLVALLELLLQGFVALRNRLRARCICTWNLHFQAVPSGLPAVSCSPWLWLQGCLL